MTQPTLHEELRAILIDSGAASMTTAELARLANERGNYRKKDGTPITAFQVSRRAYNYGHIFKIDGSHVSLR